MRSVSRCFPPMPCRQQGMVLFIALIVLVAMTLAGIGMVRSVDTGNLIAGNLAFKQATLQASDNGIETGYQWLLANTGGTTLNNTDAANGYYSAPPANDATLDWFDLANWAGAICVPTACTEDAAGNTIRYIAHRMCLNPNSAYNAANQQCALATSTTAAAGGSKAVGATVFTQTNMLYYRVMARVDGPRNTMSITQAYVQISL